MAFGSLAGPRRISSSCPQQSLGVEFPPVERSGRNHRDLDQHISPLTDTVCGDQYQRREPDLVFQRIV